MITLNCGTVMTTKREMCELSSRARAFSVEALIGVKRQRIEDTDIRQKIHDVEVNSPYNKVHQPATTSKNNTAEDETAGETKLNTVTEGDTVKSQQRLRLKQNLKVELCSRELWRKFHALGTEMIITKAGSRRMFPTVKVRLSGLEPTASYIVFLDIVPVDDKRYRYVYHSSQWMVAGSGDSPLHHNLYVHPDSAATGQLWMAQGVVAFDKLKLTNNRKPLVRGQVSLHSMHKYLPRVHILQTTDLDTPPERQACVERALTYTFPETVFTTVTAYQNQQITRLKIASNPFAKGFREASRTRDSLDNTQHQRSSEFPSPPLVQSATFYPSDLLALPPDFTMPSFSSSSSPLFLSGRSLLDPYCIPSMNICSTLFHPNQNPYGCHSAPPRPSPLTLPVKFVVPPRTDSVLSDPTRRLCFEDSSSDENMNKLTDNEHCKKICIDNYSRIILEENNSRRYISEYFQDIYLNNSHRNLSTDSHQSTDSDEPCTSIIADKQPRKKSQDNFKKLYNADDKSKTLPNGVHYRRSVSKDMLTRPRTTDEISTKSQRNIQKFLVNPIVSVACHKESCERKESKLLTAHKLELNAPKIEAASPLDLTKLK